MKKRTSEDHDLGPGTGDASSPRPDENVVSEIGDEVGVPYADTESLHTLDKVARRDRERWEMDPASAEDYPERQQELEAAAERLAGEEEES